MKLLLLIEGVTFLFSLRVSLAKCPLLCLSHLTYDEATTLQEINTNIPDIEKW
jgi:hypothetical protein